ncbi:MAG: ABC transporter permease [Cyclobacteriaceae bacterium]
MKKFNLDKQITKWRNQLYQHQYLEEGVIEELEDHLRETIDDLMQQGTAVEEAFSLAVNKLGEPESVNEGERQIRSSTILNQLMPNLLKTGIRQIRRNRLTSTINYLGLTLGFVSVIFISFFVFDELTYETHHPDYDKIYRLSYSFKGEDGEIEDRAYTSGMWSDIIREKVPGVEESLRYLMLSYGYLYDPQTNQSFYEEGIYWADQNFFDFLNYSFKYGTQQSQLQDLSSIVLTERTANKLFGNVNPIGKTIYYRRTSREIPLTVTGVIFDPPSNSLFKPDYIANIQAVQSIYGDEYRGWVDQNIRPGYISTYIKLNDPSSIDQVKATLIEQWKMQIPDIAASITPLVTPLRSIHFNPPVKWETDNPISMSYIFGLILIALFILVIAMTNYASLTTAYGSKRYKEMALRKTFGGTEFHLGFQQMLESSLMILSSLFIAAIVSFFLTPFFSSLVDKNMDFIKVVSSLFYLQYAIPIVVLIVIIAGGFPTLYFTRRSKTIVNISQLFVKEKFNSPGRNAIVTFQFAIAIIMIICTVTIYRQLDLINDGFLAKNRNTVIGIRTSRMGDSIQAQRYKQQIANLKGVMNSTLGEHLPKQSDFGRIDTRYFTDQTGEQAYYWDKFEVDGGFLDTYNLKLIAGRDFNRNIEARALIVNKKLVDRLNLTPSEAIGVRLTEDSMNYVYSAANGVIVGVVEDFSYRSIKEEIKPLVITADNYVEGVMSVRLEKSDVQETLMALKSAFHEVYPTRPFEYWFLDKEFDRLYQQERRLGRLLPIFAGLAITIALLGLFALASYIAEVRQKEIGIRKVLGCSTYGILRMLMTQNLYTILGAVTLGVPISYFAMNYWLEDFTYRTDVALWVIFVAVMSITLFALLIIGLQSFKAAVQNPVKSIKYE